MTLTGGAALERKLAEIAQSVARAATLRVGFLEGATYPDGTSVATIAALMNFGSPGGMIPARPFFTKMIEDKSPRWGALLADLLVRNNYDVHAAMMMMGEGIAGQLRQSLIDTNEPANSPVTNLLKQRFPTGEYGAEDVWAAYADVAAGEDAPAGKPLVWSGHMLNSIDFEVTA